jgi:Domain of unknown function DUF29.
MYGYLSIQRGTLRELYGKDFYLWVQENLKLLRNKEYDLVDWENLLEEIEDMGQRHFRECPYTFQQIMEDEPWLEER